MFTHLPLARPALLLLVLVLLALLPCLRLRRYNLRFPRIRLLEGLQPHPVRRRLPALVFIAGMISLMVAAAGPYRTVANGEKARRGRVIVLCLDISGSMRWPIDKDKTYPPDGVADRFELLRRAIAQLAKNREELGQGDLIELIVFDDAPRVAIGFTEEPKQIYLKADFLKLTRGLDDDLSGGTNFGGKGFGPLDLAAQEIESIKAPVDGRVVVMMTDGDDKLDEKARKRLKEVIDKHHLQLFVIGVGPVLASGKADIIELCHEVGGQVFPAGTPDQVATSFAAFNEIVRGPVPAAEGTDRQELFWVFTALGAMAITLALWGQALLLNL